MTVSAIAIILARGGSKGLPRKNLLPVAGRPCVQWTIDAARQSRLVGRLALSTDDAEMLAIADRLQVETIRRPAALASDSARIDDAARHAADVLLGPEAARRDQIFVVLYGNVPVRPDGCIDHAVRMLIESDSDSVQSYQPVGKHHPWWTARLDDGVVRPWEGDVLNHGVFRRQDLPPAYIPDGAVIVVRGDSLFLKTVDATAGPHAFFGVKRSGIINPIGGVVDIDDRYDLLLADAMLRDRAGAEGAAA